jgi:tRNA-dihydrouridine synthase A
MNDASKPNTDSPWRFSTAPCMDWSDRHCRYFWRLITRHTRVYTEMVTTGALIHGDSERHLQFNEEEHPIALQLGGSTPADLAVAAKMGADYGYDEINLNCGCPSDRVQNGAFGACLMREPELVRDCVDAMNASVDLPVTVKHRLGVDDDNSYSIVRDFVGTVAEGGAEVFIAHARNAWLQGLSPKENREIPPLNYDWVYQLKRDFPHLTIVLNGGITTLDECETHLNYVDGVMLGRAPYQNPWLLSQVDAQLFSDTERDRCRYDVALALLPYLEALLASGGRLNHVLRHVLGLYQRQPGGKLFRRLLSEGMHKPNAGTELFMHAVDTAEAIIARKSA